MYVKTKCIKVKKLSNLRELPLPQYAKSGDSARDLYAAIDNDVILEPGEVKMIPTGIALDLDEGTEAQIRPRSGLALKKLLIHFGTIDSAFKGECNVIVYNLSKEPFIINHGLRIAQLAIAPVIHYEWQEVEDLRKTDRGVGGFGSTGF